MKQKHPIFSLPFTLPPLSPTPLLLLLLLTFFTFRALTLLLFRPGGFIRDWSDFDTFLGIASLSDYDLYPFLDFWLEWPPLVPWLMVGAYKVSLWLPPWEDPRLWFVLILGAIFLLFEVGNFLLIYGLARHTTDDETITTRVMWLYAGLFPPVYTMLGFFDGIALFFVLLSLYLILKENMWSSVAIGVGFMVKVTPILMLAVALKQAWQPDLDRRRLFRAWAWIALGVAGTILVLALPFIIAAPEWLLAFIRALFGRSSWETVWAVLEGYYGFGRVAGDRLNPTETNFAIHDSTLPWTIITLAFVALYGLIFWLKIDPTQPKRMIAFTGLIFSIFLLYAKGYSPQFLVYLLPFIIFLLPNITGLGYALLLTLLNFLEQPIYFVFFYPPQQFDETWLLTFVVIARFIVLISLSIEFGLIAFVNTASLIPKLWRRTLAIGSVVSLLFLIPAIFSAYLRVQLARSPHQPVIRFLQNQNTTIETLLVTDQPIYRQLYPHLRKNFTLRLAGGDQAFSAALTANQLLQGLDQAWILSSDERGPRVLETVETFGTRLATYHLDPTGTLILYDFVGTGRPPAPFAQATIGIKLLTHAVIAKTETIEIMLFWQASHAQTPSYTVFTQLLDINGQLVANHDGIPVEGTRPTSAWLPNQVIVDTHRLALPSALPPGQYRIVVGMYDDQIVRLGFVSSNNEPFADAAIPLLRLNLPD